MLGIREVPFRLSRFILSGALYAGRRRLPLFTRGFENLGADASALAEHFL